MTRFLFPTELPERPHKKSKLEFTRQLSKKLTTSRKRRGGALSSSPSVRLPVHKPAVSSPLHLKPGKASHLLAQNLVEAVQAKKTHVSSKNRNVAPKLSRTASAVTPSNAKNSKRAISPKDRDAVLIGKLTRRTVVQSSIKRKSVPDPARHRHPHRGVERFARLRQPHSRNTQLRTSAPTLSVHSPDSNTISLQTRNKKKPVQSSEIVWNWLQSYTFITPQQETALRRHQDIANFQTHSSMMTDSTATAPITIKDDDDDLQPPSIGAGLKRWTRQSQANKRLSSASRPWSGRRKSLRQCRSRSPSSGSSISEGNLTPTSSQDTLYPDLTEEVARAQTRKDTSISQKRSGRFIDSEDATILNGMLARNFAHHNAGEDDLGLFTIVRPPPQLRRETRVERRRPPQGVASNRQGSRDNPIELNSDSDSHGPADPTQNAERMDIDAGTRWPSAIQLETSQSNGDATAAPKLKRTIQTLTRTRPCAVCGDSNLISSLPSLPSCGHPPEICASCYSDWLTAQLESSGWTEAKCPQSKCKTVLTYHEMQAFASPVTFDKYDTFITRAALGQDPNFHWCRACSSGQIHATGAANNIFTCASCGHKVCIVHQNTWHEGETCEEYDYRSSGAKERDQRAQEAASLKAMEKLSKKCPGPECIYSIEKNDGCDHMTCFKCKYEFCWICLCDYNEVRRRGNAAHKSTCKYHTHRLN